MFTSEPVHGLLLDMPNHLKPILYARLASELHLLRRGFYTIGKTLLYLKTGILC